MTEFYLEDPVTGKVVATRGVMIRSFERSTGKKRGGDSRKKRNDERSWNKLRKKNERNARKEKKEKNEQEENKMRNNAWKMNTGRQEIKLSQAGTPGGEDKAGRFLMIVHMVHMGVHKANWCRTKQAATPWPSKCHTWPSKWHEQMGIGA